MKAIIVSGSRNPEGQTGQAVEALKVGLEGEDAKVDVVFLPERKIELCRQCDDEGWGICRSEGRCVIEDDFEGIRQQVRDADVAVFATPVYYGELAESLRAFLDRLRRVGTFNDASREGIAGKPAIGVCVAGGMGGGAPNCAVSLERTLQQTRFDVVDMVPARRQNLKMKREILRTVGRWLAGRPTSKDEK